MFSESCGAVGALRLEWTVEGSGASGVREFDRPAVVLGRDPGCDLAIDEPGLARCHAYFQLVEGRLYVVALDDPEGLRWGDVPRAGGWVDPDRPVTAGPLTIRVGGGFDPSRDSAAGPPPTSSRYRPRGPLAEVTLEARVGEGEGVRRSFPVDRPLMLVGTADRCQIRLGDPEGSRNVCALVLTAGGLWAVDLLGREGVHINGARCRVARLEDGDRLVVGRWAPRVVYGSRRASTPVAAGTSVATRPPRAKPTPRLDPPLRPTVVPEILKPLLDVEAGSPEGSSAFSEALLMLIRLLGDAHRDHLEMVREELEQIRRLGREMATLKARSAQAPPAHSLGTARTTEPVTPTAEADAGPAPPRPSPVDAHLLVGERLAAWEQERESRWRKVIGLLVKS